MAVHRGSVKRALLGVLATSVLVAGFIATPGSTDSASAITGSDFQAGNIISDDLFYDSNAMTQEEIQAFLDSKIGSCSNSNCLNVKRTDTSDLTLGRDLCTPYVGADAELTSTILFKVQRACGISAKVLLVTLQKEQGLVTNKGPSDSKLARAMGYGCPDNVGGACNTAYYGLSNQLYRAAWQFNRYSKPTPWGGYQPGTLNIRTHPNAERCDRYMQTVTIENNATAALYNYTPYTPNAAALANLRGTGDSCSSYGNRNFWVFYTDWFGDTQATYPPGVTTDRIGGKDRYDVSVAISAQNFPDPVSTVYIATGTNYPDALSAAPAAAKAGAPLLLVPSTFLPASVRTEIQRLQPTEIVVVGGPGSVSPEVFTTLSGLTTTISRMSGTDRYEASRNVTANAFVDGATVAYVATGETYPDALSASAAAGSIDAPVILIPGRAATLDPATFELIESLGVTEIRIAGGPASVNVALETQMATIPGVVTVRRLTGPDRFYVSGNTNRDAFTTSTRVYLASGLNYPDALSGAAVAGAQNAPLYVIPTTCIPSYVIQDIINLGATQVTVLGGPATVSSKVLQFTRCR
jgi:putative cell wall-binding protein